MSAQCHIHPHLLIPCQACAGTARHLVRIKAETLAAALRSWIGEDEVKYGVADAVLGALMRSMTEADDSPKSRAWTRQYIKNVKEWG